MTEPYDDGELDLEGIDLGGVDLGGIDPGGVDLAGMDPGGVDLGRVWTGVAAEVWRRHPGPVERKAARH